MNEDFRRARTCYDHLAGVAGVELLDELLRRGWLRASRGRLPGYRVSAKGEAALTARGVALAAARGARRTFAAGCRDLTEPRPHLRGALGAAVLAALVHRGIVRREPHGRAVKLRTPLARWFG